MNAIGDIIDYVEITKSCRRFDVNELRSILRHNLMMYWSWGVTGAIVDDTVNTRMYRFRVRGNLHKGHVYIFLNGLDLFDIYFTSVHGKIKDIIESVYVEDLVRTIDEKIEKISDYAW